MFQRFGKHLVSRSVGDTDAPDPWLASDGLRPSALNLLPASGWRCEKHKILQVKFASKREQRAHLSTASQAQKRAPESAFEELGNIQYVDG